MKKFKAIVFFGDVRAPAKWGVTNLDTFVKFLNRWYGSWVYFNVYEKSTGRYVGRHYKNASSIGINSRFNTH